MSYTQTKVLVSLLIKCSENKCAYLLRSHRETETCHCFSHMQKQVPTISLRYFYCVSFCFFISPNVSILHVKMIFTPLLLHKK